MSNQIIFKTGVTRVIQETVLPPEGALYLRIMDEAFLSSGTVHSIQSTFLYQRAQELHSEDADDMYWRAMNQLEIAHLIGFYPPFTYIFCYLQPAILHRYDGELTCEGHEMIEDRS